MVLQSVVKQGPIRKAQTVNSWLNGKELFHGRQSSGQSYKSSTIVIYDSRVVPDLKIPHIMTLDL